MKILFITCHCLGDAALTMNVLRVIERRWPEAKVTIVTSPVAASLFASYPLLDRLIILEKKPYKLHWIMLWPKLFFTYWDKIIDFRNSFISRLLFAKKYYFKKTDASIHKIDENISILGKGEKPIFPKIWLRDEDIKSAYLKFKSRHPKIDLSRNRYAVVAPTSAWRGKEWMPEAYAELIRKIYKQKLLAKNEPILILGAPGERARVEILFEKVKDLPVLDAMALFEPIESAAMIKGACFFIGNDSALMHFSWILGTKTLALLGPAWPEIYGPLGANSAYVTTDISCEELQKANKGTKKDPTCLMTSLPVDKAFNAFKLLIR